MDVRAELLHYLFHPDGKMRISMSTSASGSSASTGRVVTRVRSTSSFTQLAADLPKTRQSAPEEPDVSDPIPLFSLTAGVMQSSLVVDRSDTGTMFQSPILRVRDTTNTNPTTAGWSGGFAGDWYGLVNGLDAGSFGRVAVFIFQWHVPLLPGFLEFCYKHKCLTYLSKRQIFPWSSSCYPIRDQKRRILFRTVIFYFLY